MFIPILANSKENNGFINYIKNNSSFQVGVGVDYYTIEEDGGNDENKASPVFNIGYNLDLTKNLFLNANLNFDVSKLSSALKFKDREYCDTEDVLEGECTSTGFYTVTADKQDIDLYRILDLNLGYKIGHGFSIFAGVNFYKIDFSYGGHSFTDDDSTGATDIDHIDDGDESAVGFGFGIIYNIKDTNFSTKLSYNQVSFDGGPVDNSNTQKIDDKKISLTLNYLF